MGTDNAIEMLLRNRDYACWFDKIEILAKQEKQHLEALLPLDVLERESKLIKIIHGSKRAKEWGHLSKIMATLPTPDFLEALYFYELSDLKTTYIEIFLDIFCDSEQQAESECRNMLQHLRKKYCRTVFIYDATLQVPTKKASTRAKKLV